MLSRDETITNDEETEHLLEAIFAAVELKEAELEVVTSSPSLYQRLQLRIGLAVPQEPPVQPIAFQPVQQFYWLDDKVAITQLGCRAPQSRSNV